MLRFAIYHWLPMADNMLLSSSQFEETSFEEGLRRSKKVDQDSVKLSIDSVEYDLNFPISQDEESPVTYSLKGKINLRGFSQHILEIKHTVDAPALWLNNITSSLSDFLANFLIEIAPSTVQNNAAVLHERIVSFQKFSSTPFNKTFYSSAKYHFLEAKIAIITLDEITGAQVNGTKIPGLGFSKQIKALNKTTCSVNDLRNSFIFISPNFQPEEIEIFDGILYKYGAILAFTNTTLLAIDILRQTRSHVPPLRRELAVALQPISSIEEDFDPFTEISRYLGYVKIKLPVIKTVNSYLKKAYQSDEFKAKRNTLGKPQDSQDYSTMASISNDILQPHNLVKRLEDAIHRIDDFLIEDKEEIGIVSEEISRHLSIALASEKANISARELEANETNRELNRGGKNRANALKGLSIVLAAGLGFTISDKIIGLINLYTVISEPIRLAFSLIFSFLTVITAWRFIDWTIAEKAAYFRMVIEVKEKLDISLLSEFINTHALSREETNRGRVLQSWSEKIDCYRRRNLLHKVIDWYFHKFEITFDYQTNGYLHLIVVESEYRNVNFDKLQIIKSLFSKLENSRCLLRFKDGDYSIFSKILNQLRIPLDIHLPGLNYLLASSDEDIRHRISSIINDDNFASEDIVNIQDINNNTQKYINWLENVPSELVQLLGKNNIKSKQKILEESKRAKDITHEK